MDEEIDRLLLLSSETDAIILLSGPANSGKTSLLFQYAFNSAKSAAVTDSPSQDSPPHVVFICKRPKLHAKPPFLSQGIDQSSPLFHLVHIKYVEHVQGLVDYFSAFHLYREFPVTVIVDDFGLYFHDDHDCYSNSNGRARGRDFIMLKTLALCCNAINHANDTGHPCKLLLSDTHQGDMPKLLYIYRRWVSSIYNIKGDSGTFLLQRIPSQSPVDMDLQNTSTKYSIALQQLVPGEFPEDTVTSP